jgi:hypothetical protein
MERVSVQKRKSDVLGAEKKTTYRSILRICTGIVKRRTVTCALNATLKNFQVAFRRRGRGMSDIKFSGAVEEDIYDMAGDELLMGAGDRVRGNLSFYDGTPYILGDIEDVCEEYCSPEYWYPVLEDSIEAELFGITMPLDRLRELAAAEREGRVYVSQYPNCGMCKWVMIDMFATIEPCKSCRDRAIAEAALAGKGETK